MDSSATSKLREYFDQMVVYKDLRHTNFFSALSLPSFTRDWLLKRFQDNDGQFDMEQLAEFVRRNIPRKSDWERIKGRLVKDFEQVRMLAKISMHVDVATGEASFSLPDFDVSPRDTVIGDSVWQHCKDEIAQGREVWGMLRLGYRPPDDTVSPRLKGKIRLLEFHNFCPYRIDPEYYKDARARFSVAEWMDVLLGAVDYNADGYESEEQKLMMLSRLLPFVEKRLNMIELAPKGTGKSYLFGQVSRFTWLSSGGTMSRSKMFYNMGKHTEGLVSGYDCVTLDEVQTISFTDVSEMRAALKGYLENGRFTVGDHLGTASAGVVLCGNISHAAMRARGTNKFLELPKVFQESALIERFHGFIEGWRIPRMRDDLKISGWGLNSEYFCTMLHELREDMTYRAVVDELTMVPEGADTRDTEAIKRLATAWLKLLFPHVRTADDITADEYRRYCLSRAMSQRGFIRDQLGIMDEEYLDKPIPMLRVRTA